MNMHVIGLGYVGLPIAVTFSELGNVVVGIDKNKEKIDLLQKYETRITEAKLKDLLIKNINAKRLSFSSSLESIGKADVITIVVDTPISLGGVDLSYINTVVHDIANYLDGYTVIVIKSTVLPGTCKKIENLIKQLNPKASFDVVSIPEFLREGMAIHDIFEPNRIVIGVESQRAKNILEKLYSPFKNKTKIFFTSRSSAEMVKYASNSFLAMKISFINEISNLCEKSGCNVYDVAYGMGLDTRIGEKFLNPGPGYGGNCFPKDTLGLASFGKSVGLRLTLVESTIMANESRKKELADKISYFVREYKTPKVAFLGLPFKAGVDDCRKSPSIDIIIKLLDKNIDVCAYDPIPTGIDNSRKILGSRITYAVDAYNAVKNADLIVFGTECENFKFLDWAKIGTLVRNKIIFDLRNIINSQEARKNGFVCHIIGTSNT
ncbi:MAG: UDP-glucose/GDP-mannose dehydrogenase family protein [Endomicrobium sp.]|nr:UDP-glucose/GDP-mannose dehydrogenase family protein [Endomicrobium sp.]